MNPLEYIKRRVGKWNIVVDYLAAPCDTPFWAALRLLPRALERPMIMMLSFGLDDVARGALRPKAVYRSGHLRRRGPGILGRIWPELGEEIGRRIPRSEILRGRAIGTPERLLWIADGILQRLGFWMLVADAITEGAYRWVQLLRAERYCARPEIKAGIIHSGTLLTTPPPHQWLYWQPLPTATKPLPWQPNDPFWAHLSTNPADHYVYALWTIRNPSRVPVEFLVALKPYSTPTWRPGDKPYRLIPLPPGEVRTVSTYGTITDIAVSIDAHFQLRGTPELPSIDLLYLLAGAPPFFPKDP